MLTPDAATQLRLQLVAIPDLADKAYEDLEPGSSAGSGMPTGTRTPPIPARLDILSLFGPAPRADVVHDPYGDQTGDRPAAAVLSSWCEVIWGYPCTSIRTACRLLLDHDNHATAITAGYAQDYAAEIAQLYHRLTRLARTYTPPVPLRCPHCRGRTLTVDPGRGYLCTDPTCAIRFAPDLYDHLAQQETNAQLIRNAAKAERRRQQQAAAALAAEQALNAPATHPDPTNRKAPPMEIDPGLVELVARTRYTEVRGPQGIPWDDNTPNIRAAFVEWSQAWTEAATDARVLTTHAYRAAYDSLPLGTYTTLTEAKKHCLHDLKTHVDIEDDRPVWIKDNDEPTTVSELYLHAATPDTHDPTGHTITPVELCRAFDPALEA